MIKPSVFKSQAELLKWLRRGGVKWTIKQLKENLPNFSVDMYGTHVHIVRLGVRRYFVGNDGTN